MPLPYTDHVSYDCIWHGGQWRESPSTTRPAPPLPRLGRTPTHSRTRPTHHAQPTGRRRKSCESCGHRIYASNATLCWRCRLASTPESRDSLAT